MSKIIVFFSSSNAVFSETVKLLTESVFYDFIGMQISVLLTGGEDIVKKVLFLKIKFINRFSSCLLYF